MVPFNPFLRGASAITAAPPPGVTIASDAPAPADGLRGDLRGRTGVLGRVAAASAVLCLGLAAGGCSWSREHPIALATPQAPPVAAPPPLRTVKPGARPAAVEDGPGPIAGIPTPRQIFDFHPPGGDGWRQPFVIDPNDGPLTGEVRKTAAELKAYLAEEKAKVRGNPQLAAPRRCGETDVAARRPGCAGAAAGSLAAVPSGAPDHP